MEVSTVAVVVAGVMFSLVGALKLALSLELWSHGWCGLWHGRGRFDGRQFWGDDLCGGDGQTGRCWRVHVTHTEIIQCEALASIAGSFIGAGVADDVSYPHGVDIATLNLSAPARETDIPVVTGKSTFPLDFIGGRCNWCGAQ